MKKIRSLLFIAMLCVFSGIAFVGCGPAKITSGRVKAGTLDTMVVKGEELDTSNVIVIYTYSDNTTKDVGAEDLTFSEISTEEVGTQTLTISYNDFSFDVNISVVATENDTISIISLQSQLLNNFNAYKEIASDRNDGFFDREQALYVGDDNAFNFRIVASGIDLDENLVEDLRQVRTNITIELKDKDSGDYRVLTDDELNLWVAVDSENTTLDFEEKAVGEEFRITVEAANRDEGYEENATKFTAELTVVDGFNVYNAKQLSIYDNTNESYREIKEEAGIYGLQTNAIILQDNITIRKKDVRKDVFWDINNPAHTSLLQQAQAKTNLEVDGTLMDLHGTGLYHRTFKDGDKFNFIGNYFSINLSEFPRMVIEGNNNANTVVNTEEGKENYMTSHMCVFFSIDEQNQASSITDKTTKMEWKNISFLGNGALNTNPENSGAIILMKNRRINFKAYNTVMNNFSIGYFFEHGEVEVETEGNYEIDSCKGYNSYQCLFYFYASGDVLIKNSEYKNSGGPAIIADYLTKSKKETRVNVVNSLIESRVTGAEPWFGIYNASTLAAQLRDEGDKLFDGSQALLPKTDKTIHADYVNNGDLKLPRMNVIAILKEGNISGLPDSRLGGYIRFFKNEDEFNRYYQNGEKTTYGLDLNDTNENGLADKAFGNTLYFEGSATGGYINQGVAANKDTTILGKIAITSLYSEMVKLNAALAVEGFENKEFEEQKETMKGIFAKLNQMDPSGNTLTQVYTKGKDAGAFIEVPTWDSLTADQKLAALSTMVNAYTFNPYAAGDYLNVYLHNGMGAVLGLYERTSA